ncbi:MAG TPA: DUF4915 domain-containing protein, partial [Tepidisphaeraceae bacterium]|nr:DUF4915 domain-containing protein [Tepidisphaeraceae bacterium]
IGLVDPASGSVETVANLPGFTRGLDFFGPYAFVGLSQVRESALSSGIPLAQKIPVEQRACGRRGVGYAKWADSCFFEVSIRRAGGGRIVFATGRGNGRCERIEKVIAFFDVMLI